MHPRSTIVAIAATALAAATLSTPAEGMQAAKPVRFASVQYDSPGSDTGSNRSLNAEWIRVKNNGGRARTLTGWTIRDPAGHVYRFPKFRLRSGRSVTLHTGPGQNTRRDLYWRQNWYVWNNTGDRAILKTRSGNRVDVCSWNDGDGNTAC